MVAASVLAPLAPAFGQQRAAELPRVSLRVAGAAAHLLLPSGELPARLAGAAAVQDGALRCAAPGDHLGFDGDPALGVRSGESFTIELELRADRDGADFRTALMCREGGAVHYSVVIGRQPGRASLELWSWASERVTSPRRIDDGAWHRLECGYDGDGRRMVMLVDGELAGVAPCRRDFAGSPRPALRFGENLDSGVRQPLHGAVRAFALRDGLSAALRAALEQLDSAQVLPAGAAAAQVQRWNDGLRTPRLPWPGDVAERAAEAGRVRAVTQDALGLWPPPGAPPRGGRPGPLDGTAGSAATDLAAWRASLPLELRRLGQHVGPGYTCTWVAWQSLPGYYATGWLFEPVAELGPGTRRPAVLCPHGHWGRGARELPVQVRGATLAAHGCVALAVDSVHHEVPALGLSSLSVMTWNNLRALQLLRERDDIDPGRIGCTGASGGGQQTYYLAGLDAGLAAAAPVVMAASFGAILPHDGVHCRCNHVPHLAGAVDMPELAAAFAPRPQLFVTVAGDWTARFGQRAFPAVRAVYAALGAEDDVRLRHFGGGHRFDAELRGVALGFLAEQLGLPSLVAAARAGDEVAPPPADWLDVQQVDVPRDLRPVTAEFRARLAAPPATTASEARARLRRLFRPGERGDLLAVRDLGGDGRGAHHFAVRNADGIDLPVRRFAAATAHPGAAAVLVLDGTGGHRFAAGRHAARIAALRADGCDVFLADLRYCGELDVGAGYRDAHGRFHGEDAGRLALHDLLTLLDAGLELGVRGPWQVLADGHPGATALFAAALDERIRAVEVLDLGPTWTERADRAPRTSRLLLHGDLPDAALAAASGGRSVRLGGVTDPARYAAAVQAGVELRRAPLRDQ